MSGTYYEQPDAFGDCECPGGGCFIEHFEQCQHCGGNMPVKPSKHLPDLAAALFKADEDFESAAQALKDAEDAMASAAKKMRNARTEIARWMHSNGDKQRVVVAVNGRHFLIDRMNIDSAFATPVEFIAP